MTAILFYVSLLGMISVLGAKVFEMKVRRINSVSRLVAWGDSKIHQSIEFAIYKYRIYKKISALFIFDFLPSYAYELTVKLKDYLAKKYYNMGDDFRGRRVLRSDGSVSAFLERLSERRGDSLNHEI